jgi:hypothetical protein
MKLGEKVRDKITGYEGIAYARTEYLNGCIRIGIQDRLKQDGTVPDMEWGDQSEIEVTKKEKQIKGKDPGGPIPKPRQIIDPRR